MPSTFRDTDGPADSRRWREGMGLLTVAKCYGFLWSANPCRLVYAHWDRKLPRELVRRFFLISSSPSSLRRPWKASCRDIMPGVVCLYARRLLRFPDNRCSLLSRVPVRPACVSRGNPTRLETKTLPAAEAMVWSTTTRSIMPSPNVCLFFF